MVRHTHYGALRSAKRPELLNFFHRLSFRTSMQNTTTDHRPMKNMHPLPPTATIGCNASGDGRPASTRKTRPALTTLGLLCCAGLYAEAMANVPGNGALLEAPGGSFASADLGDWAERSFEGNTQYRLEEENGVKVLRGETRGQASVLYREQEIDLDSTPIVEWSWKVDGTYADIDERSRSGDDFPARLYVVVKTGFLPWDTLAINYVWSSQSAPDEAWPNPFTDKAHMVVVQSGEEHVGSWVGQRRNVAEDFKQYFDIDVSNLDGYAVMVDGDNAGREGTAWFGEISFSAE